MGIKIGLSGLNDYSKTLEQVRAQPADAKVAPDYDAVRQYVNSGSARGELRVKYGNHRRELELGTKGLFAKGERHALTVQVLSDVVAKRFGPRAAQKFMDRVAVEQEGQGIQYRLDKAHVRGVLQELEAQHAQAPVAMEDSESLLLARQPVAVKPELFHLKAGDAQLWRANFADTWTSANVQDGEKWPQSFVKDLYRSQTSVQGGRLHSAFGGAPSTDPAYQKAQKEKFNAFLEEATGLPRSHAGFENLRNNLARNLHQGFVSDLIGPALLHASTLGYGLPQTDNDAAHVQWSLGFEGGHFLVERSTELPMTFMEGFTVKAAMTDSLRLPLQMLLVKESDFDIAAAITDPQRSISLVPVDDPAVAS